MTAPRPAATAKPPGALLCVLARGLEARAAAALPVVAGLGLAQVHLQPDLQQDVVALWSQTSDLLWPGGIEVDRRSLMLAPPLRSDATSVELLARRATGPARVALLELREVGDPNAVARHVARALAVLRRGAPTELWLVAPGRPRSTWQTIDLRREIEELLGPLAGLAQVVGDHRRVTVHSGQASLLDAVARQLQQGRWRRHLRIEWCGLGGLVAHARAGVTFAVPIGHPPEPTRADGPGAAFLPCAPRTARRLGQHELMARFCLRAWQLFVRQPTPPPAPRSVPATTRSALRRSTPIDLPTV